jgi:Heparinase II C-terminal domain/Heparinase II/III-like protein
VVRPIIRLSILVLLAAAASAAEVKWIDADGVRIVEPPHEHPRLYLRTRDLPDLRRRLTHPILKPAWEGLQTAAKENPQIRVEVDALRYLLDRNAQLGRRTAADALSLLQKSQVGKQAENESRKIGRMMVTGAIVYDWCYPEITTEQKAAFIAEFVRLAKTLECSYPPKKTGLVIGHPSEWMIMRDMLSAGVATYDENPEMYRLAAVKFFGTHVPVRNWWYPGGAFHQGPGYADARFQSDMYPLWIFDRMGAGNVFNPSQQFVPYEWIYLRRPDLKFIRSADGQNWPTRLGSLLTASYYGDGYILANFLKDPVADPEYKLLHFLWRDSKPLRISDNTLFELLWREPDLKPSPISDLPLSRYFGFPYGGMVARTGWDSSSVIVQMRMNIYNFIGHQHLDAGSFEIYYKGPLAIHSGVYQGITGGYGSPHHVNYYQRTVAHNSLLIYDPQEKFAAGRRELDNDGGQRLPNNWQSPNTLEDMLQGTFKTGTVLGQGFGPDPQKPAYTYLKGDITQAYSDKAREVKRSFVFLNLGRVETPAALIVFDRVVAASPAFQKYWLLQSVTKPTVEGSTAVVSLSQNGWTGRLRNTTLLPEPDNARLATVGGSGKEFWVFGKNYPNATEPPDPEVGGWRVELSPKQPAATDLFLNVMQVMDQATGKPLSVEKIDGRGVVGAQLSDRVVLFNPRGDRSAEPISFAASGGGTLKFLVTDVVEGAWQVWRDGRIARPAVVASGDAGVLYFEGSAGSYSLRR